MSSDTCHYYLILHEYFIAIHYIRSFDHDYNVKLLTCISPRVWGPIIFLLGWILTPLQFNIIILNNTCISNCKLHTWDSLFYVQFNFFFYFFFIFCYHSAFSFVYFQQHVLKLFFIGFNPWITTKCPDNEDNAEEDEINLLDNDPPLLGVANSQ